MRNRTTLTLVLGLIVGISGAAYVGNKERAKRTPASVGTSAKKAVWLPPPLGKHLALVKVEITPPQNIPESGNDEVAISARILVSQDLTGDLSYRWTLPEDVKIVEGLAYDKLSGVRQGQIVEVKLIVSGFNKEMQRLISIQASAQQGTSVLGNSAVIASRPEDTWESVATDMRKDAEEQLGSTGAKGSERE